MKRVSVPKDYNSELVWRDKCLYILYKYGPLYGKEIAKKIAEMEPNINITVAEERISYNLCLLKAAGKIKTDMQTGRKFRYVL